MGKQKTQVEHEIALRVGARIRQLREIQRISQIKLATEIGIRAGPLGWIEKGKHLPSGRVLYRLAKQLNVRIDDLFQEQNVWEESAAARDGKQPVMLPPMDNGVSAGAEPLKSAHIICLSVAQALLKLETLCGVVKTSSLALTIPFAPTERGAEYLAGRLRQDLGIGETVTHGYLEALESAGVRVIFLDMPEGCPTFSGYDPQNRNALIFVNSRLKKQPELQLFRLAFELGRVCWYVRETGEGQGSGGPLPENGAETLSEAEFARRFAAFFLMPARAVQASVWQLGLSPVGWTWELLLRLKKRYGVSAQRFALRLQALGLSWTDKQKKTPSAYRFKEEIEAFYDANGKSAEPGGTRPPLVMNGRLGDLLLCAERLKEKETAKAVHAVKRVLRQAGVRID